MKIQVLPELVANQIAAGEVVDRPASVVRELIDNAVDAGAYDVCVSIGTGGHSFIRVTDDGCGMERDDALLAFERHATSKIRTAEELRTISTYGFRGEALPSIASVSKVRLRTRAPGASAATEVRIEAGKRVSVIETQGSFGTEIDVSQLFFNTPARRKFLKSPRTEELKVRQWMSFASLARPQVRYRLLADGKEVLNLPRRDSMLERAQVIFRGVGVTVEDSVGPCRLSGIVLHPSQAQAGASQIVTLVNGRLVSDRLLLRAIKEGFSGTLKEREYPVGVVAIDLPPADVDVNVHPQKSEVRFFAPQAVFQCVRNAVSRAVSNFRIPLQATAAVPTQSVASPEGKWMAPSAASGSWEPHATEQQGLSLLVTQPNPGSAGLRFSDLRYVGQIFECYLLCELRGSLVIVDMHAAHERLNYNRLRRLKSDGPSAIQSSLSLKASISESGAEFLTGFRDELRAVGFAYSIAGDSLTLESHPALLSAEDAILFLCEICGDSVESGFAGSWEERVDKLCARAACHASVRSGKTLSEEEVRALFAAMDYQELSAACPHGRPVIVSFQRSQVERWFGRDR